MKHRLRDAVASALCAVGLLSSAAAFVRRFTVNNSPDVSQTIAEAVTAYCFSGIQDKTQSGLIFSVELLTKYAANTKRRLAHEIGHALLHRPSWPPMDEHLAIGGGRRR